MANTITQTAIIQSSREYVNYITLVSDGSEETDLIIYDSSVVCAALGIPDQLNSRIDGIHFSGSKGANTATLNIEFDASTDVLALPINFSATGDSHLSMDFRRFGGLKNYAGAGKTGDLLLTTTGLDAGDMFIIVLEIRV